MAAHTLSHTNESKPVNTAKENMERPIQLDPEYVNRKVSLPYELTIGEVTKAVSETYRLFNGVNNFLTTKGFRPL